MKPRRLLRRSVLLGSLFYFCFSLLWRRVTDRHLLLKKAVDNVIDDLAFKVIREWKGSSDPDLTRIIGTQSMLSCLIGEGRWEMNSTFPTFLIRQNCYERLHIAPICEPLRGKKLLFVGPDTTYHLHSLWLSTLEDHENRSHTCLGREYCYFHHICRPPLGTNSDNHPPEPEELLAARKTKTPSVHDLLEKNSSLFQYALSTNLHDTHDAVKNLPQIDSWNGVRVSNVNWRRLARKSDIVVLNRGPSAAPAFTYTQDISGNWTFTQSLCRNYNYLGIHHACNGPLLELHLVNTALHITIESFLPSLLHTLRAISEDSGTRSSLVVWQGSWYIQPLCANANLPKAFPLFRDIWSNQDQQAFVDPWSLYYNTQVYIHDRLLPKILPHFNITYVPLTVPVYVEPHLRFVKDHGRYSSRYAKDCLRNPWPAFGKEVLEKTFFTSLSIVLSRG